MKRCKRILSLLLVMVALVCMIPLPASAAQAEVVVKIPKKTELTGGEYVVTLSLSGNTGFAAAQIELAYNSKTLTCKEVTKGTVLNGMVTDSNPTAGSTNKSAILSAAGSKNVTANGTLASFVFEKPGAGSPDFSLKVCELTAANGKKMSVKITTENHYNDSGNSGSTGGDGGSGSAGGNGGSGGGWVDDPPTEDEPEEDETPVKNFTDVTTNHWAKNYIDKAVKKGWLSGYPNGSFKPNKVMSRAEFMSVLWSASDKPKTAGSTGLSDVKKKDWYYDAVSWGYRKGYISGVSASKFDPDGSLTREQAVMILYNMCGRPKAKNVIYKYKDYKQVSAYAVDAMNWAVANEIISGTSATTLSPKENATRAQITVIMVDYWDED